MKGIVRFNYRTEIRIFNNQWIKLEKEYRKAGMSEYQIQEMREFDMEWFRSRRNHSNHTQELPNESFESEESSECSSLFKKFESLSVDMHQMHTEDRLFWIEDPENENLVKGLKQLTNKDLNLLTDLVIEKYSQADVAKKLGCSQKAISKRIIKIFAVLNDKIAQ